jgi:hypothetical protein
MIKKENDQLRKIVSLLPFHPKCAEFHLVSEAKQDRAWLVPGWDTNLQKRLLKDKQFGDSGGMPSKFK